MGRVPTGVLIRRIREKVKEKAKVMAQATVLRTDPRREDNTASIRLRGILREREGHSL